MNPLNPLASAKETVTAEVKEETPEAIQETIIETAVEASPAEIKEDLEPSKPVVVEEVIGSDVEIEDAGDVTEPDERDEEIARLKAQLAEASQKVGLYEQNEQELERVREALAKIKFYTLRRGNSLTIDIPLSHDDTRTIKFKFENGSLRLSDPKLIEMFENEMKTNIALRQAVYNSAEQHQQDVAKKHAERASAQKAMSMGAAGSQVELNPAQQAELALRQQQAQGGGAAPTGPTTLDRIATT